MNATDAGVTFPTTCLLYSYYSLKYCKKIVQISTNYGSISKANDYFSGIEFDFIDASVLPAKKSNSNKERSRFDPFYVRSFHSAIQSLYVSKLDSLP